MMKPDAEIVEEVVGGNAAAYGALVERYRNVVYGLAYHQLRNFDDARDVAQEAFIAAYVHLRALREPARFGAWLRQLTLNECRMWRRRQRPTEPLDAHACLAAPAAPVETRLAVWQALEALPEPGRLTLILFHFEERSLAEIALFLDVPVTTVKSRLRSARAQLRREWMQMTQEQFQSQRLPADFTVSVTAFFEAVRSNDAAAAARFVDQHPALVSRRYAHREGPWREGTWAALEDGETAGDTALHFAAFHGYAALAGALLDRGAGIDALDHDGKSPLELAAWEGGAEVLRLLLERGADVPAFGAKALYAAAEHFATDRCDLLLAAGAEPDLHTAVMLGMADRVSALLDTDPSLPNARDKRGRTPLDVAAEWGNRAVADLLIERGAVVDLVQAAGLGMLERVKERVNADPGAVNPTDGSRTPLMAAAQSGHIAVIEYLLSKGADVHLGQQEYVHRVLPIHVAAAGAVGPLAAAGAEIDVPYRGYTPLARALSRGDEELAEALRRYGAKEAV